MMTFARLFWTAYIGALTGTSLNLLAVLNGSGVGISRYSIDYPFFSGVLALPALVIAPWMGKFSRGWLAAILVVCVSIMFFMFFVALIAGLPGSDFFATDLAVFLVFLSFLSFFVAVFRLPGTFKPLVVATCLFGLLVWMGLRLTMSHLMEKEIAATLAGGGCVYESMSAQRKLAKADDVRIGWFISRSSERPIFVLNDRNYAWAFGQWGVASRRGRPVEVRGSLRLTCAGMQFPVLPR